MQGSAALALPGSKSLSVSSTHAHGRVPFFFLSGYLAKGAVQPLPWCRLRVLLPTSRCSYPHVRQLFPKMNARLTKGTAWPLLPSAWLQDASAFAAEGEKISFLALQARVASVRQVLMGYYKLVSAGMRPLHGTDQR